MNDIVESLKNFSNQLVELQKSNTQVSSMIDSSQEGLEIQKMNLLSKVSHLREKMHHIDADLRNLVKNNRFKTIEDIPGVKIPKWYVVDIEFPAQTPMNTVISTETIINAEGPIVITQMNPLWQITQSEIPAGGAISDYFANPVALGGGATSLPTNRILPCTSYANVINTLGHTNTTGASGYNNPSLVQLLGLSSINPTPENGILLDIPEIAFQIEIIGSGRFWTNEYIPAAAFYGYDGKPLYLATSGYIDRTDKIKINAKTLNPTFASGKVRFCIHGYEILGRIDITKALGY